MRAILVGAKTARLIWLIPACLTAVSCSLGGMVKGKAAKDAAKVIAPQLGADPRTGDSIDAKALIRFRDKLRAGDGSDTAKKIYNDIQKESGKWPPDEAAARLLALLNEDIS